MDLDPEVFGAPRNANIVHQVVRWQRAKTHQGTHQALTRTMMKRGNTKPFKQKGTGRARQGSFRSPLQKGGAVVFGPLHKDTYEFRVPKQVKRLALAAVLTDKVKKSCLVIVDEFNIKSGKTKDLAAGLKSLGIDGKKAMIVVPQRDNSGIWRSSQNIPTVNTLSVAGVNVYDVMKARVLLISKDAVADLQNRIKAA